MEQTKTKSVSLLPSSSMLEDIEREANELLPSLPKAMEGSFHEISFYQGVWHNNNYSPISTFIYNQKFFQSRDDDIFVITFPKAGTTWIKALTYSVVNRTRYTPTSSPLLTTNPHILVPFMDAHLTTNLGVPDPSTLPSPRMLSTHLPYWTLPESVKRSKCSIVYLCRNPFDAAISFWHFLHHLGDGKFDISLEDYVEMYFKGVSWYGPFWDNVLGYWKESLENPNKVLFLKYEDLKEDCIGELKKLAEFLGCPFSEEEERDGTIEGISELCSFQKLRDLEVNKSGMYYESNPNKAFFRKGKVGDGINSVSPSKKQYLQSLMDEKLRGSGLSFKISI